MAKLYNLARMSISASNSTTLTIGSAATGFLSFSDAGIQNGDTITYAIEDGNSREIGRGVINTTSGVLTRSVLKSTNGGSVISISAAGQVFITMAAEDIDALQATTGNFATSANVGANVGLTTTGAAFGNSTINLVINSVSFVFSGNLQANSTTFQVGNSTVNTVVNSTSITIGTNAIHSTTGFSVGNSTVNATINSSAIYTTTSINVGSNAQFLATSFGVGNSTVNAFINSTTVLMSGNGQLTTTTLTFGNSTVNAIINSSVTQISGCTIQNSTAFAAGANAIHSTTTFSVGNSTVNAVLNSSSLFINGTDRTTLTRKNTVWVPAIAMTSRTTNGPAAGSVEMTTNKQMLKTLDFDTSTQEFAQFSILMPKGWNESTITFRVIWSHASTTTNFGVAWALEAVAFSDDDAIDTAFGTAVQVTDTGGTTNDQYLTAESSALTIGGTPAEMDIVYFQIKRVPADAADTMAIDARLHGVHVYYTTAALDDT